MNELISVCSIFFAFIFKVTVIPFLISAIAAMIFDSQFILIQRYNRPRVLKILEKENYIFIVEIILHLKNYMNCLNVRFSYTLLNKQQGTKEMH